MKYRVVTNESFEKYIDFICKGRRGRRFEGRFDTLDLDDITDTVDVPSEGEINNAIRELDLVDDVAIKTGANDIEVGSDGKIRLLDFDEPADTAKKDDTADARTAGLDLDEPKRKRGRKKKSDNTATADDDKVRELDLDDVGIDVKQQKSNLGNAIGKLDFDDVDMSKVMASIEDVYTALSSSDPNDVKSIIKRYAVDLKDENRLIDVMLSHAVQLNYDSLRAMCGDMKIVLSAEEKRLGFIDRNDIKECLERLRSISSKLTGEHNKHGLIPDVIVSCDQDNQINAINIINFLIRWCGLPIFPIYFRGAMIRKLYDLARFILGKLPNGSFDASLLTGTKGLLTYIKNYDDIPKNLLVEIMENVLSPESVIKLPSRILGDMAITAINNGHVNKVVKLVDFESNKGNLILNYIEDNDLAAWDIIKRKLKLED